MTDAADLRHAEITPDARRRLAEIERERRQHVDALSRLSDESAAIIAALAGASERAGDHDEGAGAECHDAVTINFDDLETIPRAAADYGVTDKTLRRWARKHGAIVHIGGRVYVDTVILSRSVICRKVPNFSLSIRAPSRETTQRENRK